MTQEVERISGKAKGERIQVTSDNRLVINGAFLPNWYAAKRAVESFLLENALRQTAGNLTQAGKLLGVSKVQVFHAKPRITSHESRATKRALALVDMV